MVVFGYCLLARMLSLIFWNRCEALNGSLVGKAFFHARTRSEILALRPGAAMVSDCSTARGWGWREPA
jgi:hypothetical protein